MEYNISSNNSTQQPADKNYKEIKKPQMHQVIIDDRYIGNLLAEDMDTREYGSSSMGVSSPILGGTRDRVKYTESPTQW